MRNYPPPPFPLFPKIVYSISLIHEKLSPPPLLPKIVYYITSIHEKLLPPFSPMIVYSITSIYEKLPPTPRYCAVLLQSMRTYPPFHVQ